MLTVIVADHHFTKSLAAIIDRVAYVENCMKDTSNKQYSIHRNIAPLLVHNSPVGSPQLTTPRSNVQLSTKLLLSFCEVLVKMEPFNLKNYLELVKSIVKDSTINILVCSPL
jgi:hypothetical protein